MVRILVVDDEPDILELVRFGLSSEGFQVDTATTGNEALDYVARQKPDIMVLDLMLPDKSGTDVCKQIRSNSALEDLPIIIMVHGGAWTYGNKQNAIGPKQSDFFTDEGFIYVSINYRLAPDHPFPAPVPRGAWRA